MKDQIMTLMHMFVVTARRFQCLIVIRCSSVLAMTSLLDRLKKLHVPSNEPVMEFSNMSLLELEESVVDFGSTHRGKRYIEMWQNHQSWIQWFISHYSSSGKPSHRKMIAFITLKIERCELEGSQVPRTEQAPVDNKTALSKWAPKKKSQPSRAEIEPPTTAWSPEIDPSWEEVQMDQIEEIVETKAELAAMQTRMLHMENAIQMILQHVSAGSAKDPTEQ